MGICLPISFFGAFAGFALAHSEGFVSVLVQILSAPAMAVFLFGATDIGATLGTEIYVLALLAQLWAYFVVVVTVRSLYRRIRKRAS